MDKYVSSKSAWHANCTHGFAHLLQILILQLDCVCKVKRLTKKFYEFKRVVEETQLEVDATRLIVIELTNKLKDL